MKWSLVLSLIALAVSLCSVVFVARMTSQQSHTIAAHVQHEHVQRPVLENFLAQEAQDLYEYSQRLPGFALTRQEFDAMVVEANEDGICPITFTSGTWIYTDYGCLKQWVEQVGKKEM